MSEKPIADAHTARHRAELEKAAKSANPIEAATARLQLATSDAFHAWYVAEIGRRTRKSTMAAAFHSVIGSYVMSAALTLSRSGVDPQLTIGVLLNNIAVTALAALKDVQSGNVEVRGTTIGADGVERDLTLDDFRRRS